MTGSSPQDIAFAGHLGLASAAAPLLAHSARSTAPTDQIDALADMGFAGTLDIFLKLRPPREQEAMGRRLAERGLRMGSFGGDPHHWNAPLWSSTDAEARDTLRRSIRQSVAAMRRVGGGRAVCVTGLDPARPRTAQIAGMIENLKRFGEMAGRAGLTLLVEPVAPAWIPGLLVDNLADAVRIVRSVDNPSVRLMFDIGHVAMMEEDILPALARYWDLVDTVQAADTPGRIDLGLGELDWPAILGWIAAQRYDGMVEIEHQPVDPSAGGEARLVERLRRLNAALRKEQI